MNAATRADAGNGEDDNRGGPGCTHRSAASSSVRTAQAESSTTASGSFAQLLGIEPGDLPIEQGLIVRDLALIGRDELDPLVAGEEGESTPRADSRAGPHLRETGWEQGFHRRVEEGIMPVHLFDSRYRKPGTKSIPSWRFFAGGRI